LCDITLIQ